MDAPAVRVVGLRKDYGSLVAVGGVSFAVERGEVFGLLGPNGAGKTTILESIEGLRVPTAGEIRVLGIDPTRDPRELRDRIGVQLQTSGLPATMTVDRAIRLFCAYHGVPPRHDLIDRLGLDAKRSAAVGELSTGQQRRLAVALAIAHGPSVVVFDEPTAALDVESRSELHRIIEELRREGAAVLLATHDMAEAEKLADQVAILLRGSIVAMGTPRELTAGTDGTTRISVRTERNSLGSDDGRLPGFDRRAEKDGYHLFFTDRPGPTVAALIAHIESRGDSLIDLRVERPSLEERFLELTTADPAEVASVQAASTKSAPTKAEVPA